MELQKTYDEKRRRNIIDRQQASVKGGDRRGIS